ncbi:hypothetical protein Zm00014a_043212 [Zea mays]|uniref:Uncharacterized protein n=1 Tax=Zea mays TaxID=4577 RepID=A0A3L6FV43_MAIZE|nr:hypothetical protein Zm00014a_043212 [Zea mays]
MTIPQFIIPQF